MAQAKAASAAPAASSDKPAPTPWLLRPVAYVYHFASGTITGGLNGMAKWGRIGAFWGTVAGVVGAIAFPHVVVGGVLAGALGGFVTGIVGGAVMGGAVNTVLGGTRQVGTAMKQDHAVDANHHKHQQELAAHKAQAQAARAEKRALAIEEHARAHAKPHKEGHFTKMVEASRAGHAQGADR